MLMSGHPISDSQRLTERVMTFWDMSLSELLIMDSGLHHVELFN